MRVLVVSPYYPPAFSAGGGARSIANVAVGLVRAGAGVNVVTTDSHVEGQVPHRRVEQGVSVLTMRARGTPGLRRYAFAPDIGRAVADNLARADACVLEGVWSFPLAVASRLCRRVGVPYVICARGTLETLSLSAKAPKKRLYTALIVRRAIRGAAGVLFSSSRERDNSAAMIVGTQALIVPNALDAPVAPGPPRVSLRQRLDLPDAALLIGMAGRMHPRKGFDVIVPALARCDDRIHLVVFGPDSEHQRTGLERTAARCGVRDRVHFVGYLVGDELEHAYSSIDLLVLPSHGESFGNVVLEALARGKEVLVSHNVPLGEYVTTNRLGAVVDGLDPATWGEALDSWLARFGSFDGDRASRLVLGEFAPERIGRRLLTELTRLPQLRATLSTDA